jgi:hypothetical protein
MMAFPVNTKCNIPWVELVLPIWELAGYKVYDEKVTLY